jgi:3-oxoacyl-[acyl-carrier protein] reductase
VQLNVGPFRTTSPLSVLTLTCRITLMQAAAYSGSKAAVNAVTVSLSQELGPRKIRVNSLEPGMIETEGLRTSGMNEGEFRDYMKKTTPLGRIGKPDDIALAATFLASDDARWITGQVIVAAGGKRM